MEKQEMIKRLRTQEQEDLEITTRQLDEMYTHAEKLVARVALLTGLSEETIIRSCAGGSNLFAKGSELGKWYGILTAVNAFYLEVNRLNLDGKDK